MHTAELVASMRAAGADFHFVELKAAAGGLPSSVVETLSAFSNGGGGTLLLGLDEASGFRPVLPEFDALRMRDALAGACADKMDPPLRLDIEIEELEGAAILRVDVPELDPLAKPCFVKARGAYQGSYIRGGDGDRRLTHYEITQLLANRTQPRWDQQVLEAATVADLDDGLVRSLLETSRRRSPRAFQNRDDVDALMLLGAVARDESGAARPTLAGLLSLGIYPQQFFPQLFISFVALPGVRLGQLDPDGARLLDNQTITGPVPTMVTDAVAALIRNMRKAAIIKGLGREDRYDYPLDVIRELVVNALMHRDYSPEGCATQIQIELFIDRLVIKSPGGLYGAVTVDMLGSDDQVSTSRNRTLAALLADLPLPGSRGETICENRGSGIPQVMESLRQVGMSPPTFDAAPGSMKVTVPQHALLAPDTIEWIGSLRQPGLTDSQHLALAMMRMTGRATNPMLQAWGIDSASAGQALRDLVSRGLATISGGRRYASYRLSGSALPGPLPFVLGGSKGAPTGVGVGVGAQRDAIVQAIRAGHSTPRALADALGVNYRTVARRLAELTKDGVVARTQPPRSRNQSYRLIEQDE